MSGKIVLLEGDITQEKVDAIVNAANERLLLGSGVAGAIREQGGPSIQQECDAHGPISVGEAAITGAGNLAARHIIHAAGMPLGGMATEESVRSAMASSLRLAKDHRLETIAVPAIGAGVGSLSMQRAAEILIEEAQNHLQGDTSVQEVRFVLFGEPAYRVFEMVNDASKIKAQMEKLGVN